MNECLEGSSLVGRECIGKKSILAVLFFSSLFFTTRRKREKEEFLYNENKES